MDNFEKLEIALQGMIRDHERELERARGKHNPTYIQGLEHELIGFHIVLGKVNDIKNNGYSVTDQMVEKIWKPKIT